MSQPPYGVPPQPGQPQPYPGQPAPQGYPQQPGYPAGPPQGYPPQPGAGQPPAYLQGGAPGGAPVTGTYGPALPPAPPSKKRTIGLLMGLLTTALLLGFVALVLIISKTN